MYPDKQRKTIWLEPASLTEYLKHMSYSPAFCMLCWEMVCKSHQYVLSFRQRLCCVCSPEIIHISLCCFLRSELFSYYLYLMDLTRIFTLLPAYVYILSEACDKAQWVKLDGSGWDAASETMRSRWPPHYWLFLLSLSLLSGYIYIIASDIRDSSLVSDRRLNLMCSHGNWRLNTWPDESSSTFSLLLIWLSDRLSYCCVTF